MVLLIHWLPPLFPSDEEVMSAVRTAELDRNTFWSLVNRCRKNKGNGAAAIRGAKGKVVHEVRDVLEVWRQHFSRLGTPKVSQEYNQVHYEDVTHFVMEYNREVGDDMFLDRPFARDEVDTAIKALHFGKATGYDGVSAEHLFYAGDRMRDLLCVISNKIRENEYIPQCFRVGVQIPLFKGKDLPVLDPNSYRGITLLSTFNKLFEVLVWQRMKGWWVTLHEKWSLL